MFGDTFDTVEDIMTGQDYGSIASVQQRRPKNCASDLDLPELKRLKVENNQGEQQSLENQFAGIKNQGATCYLNSLIQSLYMSPEFRQAIYDIPLCGKSIDEKSGFIKNEKKFNILIAFQKIFAEMQALDVRAISTEELTKSFGWGENQGLQQQDIQEALRVIYDALDRALQDTQYQNQFMKNYKGMLVNHITCLKCGNAKEREEEFYDLILQVQGFESVEQSLKNLITPETLDGDNQYFCENCDCKNDALKGQKVRVFPDILTVSLNRFVFDLQTFTRVKVDSVLKYGLELNIQPFLEHSEQVDPKNPDMIYELQGVLIHRGNAHGGHYHAYIRDVLGEGNWQSLMKEFLVEKEEEKKKQQEKDEKIEIERQKEIEKNNKDENNMEIQEEKGVCSKIAEADDEDSDNNSDKKSKQQKGKNKREISALEKKKDQQQNKKGKQKGNNQQTTHPSGKNAKQRKKEKSKQKNEEKKKQAILDIQSYDSKEYPIPYDNKKLSEDWYDFNDSSVTVVPVNRLQSQFGGNSESGYILIYRRKTLQPQKVPEMPQYLKNYVQSKNNLLDQERNVYQIAEQHIEIFFTDFKNIDLPNYKWAPQFEYEKEGKKLKFSVKDTLSAVFQKIKEEMKLEGNFSVVEIFEKYTNKLIQFPKLYKSDNQEFLSKTIEELQISHFSSWIILEEKNEEHQQGLEIISKKVGEEANPIKLQIVVQGKKNENLIAWSNMKLKEFRELLVERFPEIKYNEQYIKEYQGNDQVNHLNSEKSKDEQTLTELKIYENHDLILQRIDANLLENIQQDKEKKEAVEKDIKEQDKELVSILVETDENHDSNRIFVQLDWTLDYLVEHIKEKLEIRKDAKRRLKNLQYNQLYFEDEYSKKLQDLDDFAEGGIRLQIERGSRPLSGNIIVNFINQSNQYQKESTQDIVSENQIIRDSDKEKKQEILIDEKATASKLKQQICEKLNLKASEHKLYKTDHLQEPYQAIRADQENNILKSLAIKSGDLLMLRHESQLIQSEIKQFKLFLTCTGLSDDTTPIGDLSISQTATLSDLKQKLMSLPEINPMNEELDPKLLRIRARKKDLFFGPILRKEDKQLKKFTFSTNQIVVQVLNEPEELTDNQLNLILRKRDVQNRVYVEDEEFIFDAGSAPTMSQLFDQVIAHLNKKKQKNNGKTNDTKIEEEFEQLNLQDIRLVKYFPHEYTYKEICQETVDDFTKNTKRKASKKQQNQEINIKKAPFLIKDDGDIIGYILEKENQDNIDDFQTDQDNQMYLQAQERKRQNKIQQEAIAYSRGGGKKEVGVTIQSFDEEEEIALAIKQVEEFERLQKEQEKNNQ